MTLLELVTTLKLQEEVTIPCVIENFEVSNVDDFCRIAELNCLKSDNFKDDLIEILSFLVSNSMQEAKIPLEHLSLIFVKDEFEKLHLMISSDIVVFY